MVVTRGHTLAEMQIFEDGNLESPVLCEAKWLVDHLPISDYSGECPACTQGQNESEAQHLDAVILVSAGAVPDGVLHGLYAAHLKLGLTGVRLVQHGFSLAGASGI